METVQGEGDADGLDDEELKRFEEEFARAYKKQADYFKPQIKKLLLGGLCTTLLTILIFQFGFMWTGWFTGALAIAWFIKLDKCRVQFRQVNDQKKIHDRYFEQHRKFQVDIANINQRNLDENSVPAV